MSFKNTPAQFQIIDVALIEPDTNQPRRQIDQSSLKGLANSIQMKGLIHPLLVQPVNAHGKHALIVGERRWRAALLAGEETLPVLIRHCEPDEALEIQVFENLGLGMRMALEPRDMANAIKTIAERFETREAAAEHFGRNATWLNQATAAANLSTKVTALLDSGKISSTGAAVQLEKLAQKNEDKAESLIVQIEQLPDGKKLSKKDVDSALSEESGRRKKKDDVTADSGVAPASSPANTSNHVDLAPPKDATPTVQEPGRHRVNPTKVQRVAKILGLTGSDEEDILVRLIDEFLALNEEAS